MLRTIFTLILLYIFQAINAAPRVPSTMQFAGMTLTIHESAKKQIQDDVEALHRNPTYFQKKLEKVDQYFPIIERVFREENVPDDFKYLVIQESALIGDAVSTSNAVGYWQFKEVTGKEVGLTIDRNIDERMHIVASTHGAAKYLKKNNFFFNNWIYALLAYNTGPGGAEQFVEKKYLGVNKMEITKHTHWYVKKFLAHKIAFEDEIYKNPNPEIRLYEYTETRDKSLKELSDLFQIDQNQLAEYNRWIRRNNIPGDKDYIFIVPVSSTDQIAHNILAPGKNEIPKSASSPRTIFTAAYTPPEKYAFEDDKKFPVVKKNVLTKKISINGIPGFIASSNDRIATVTIDHDITQKKFLKYNDLVSSDEIIPGQVYYLKPKKSKAKIHYHVVIPGESAWSVSQKYGIKLRQLLTKNRMKQEKDLASGMVMWMRFIRPEDVPVEYRNPVASNVSVQSYPNQNTTPQEVRPTPTSIEANSPPIKKIPAAEESEFIFEEIDEQTQYIDRNSYVNLQNVQKNEVIVPTSSGTSDLKGVGDSKSVEKTKINHIVNSGETLFSIARKYEVSIGDIRQWNSIDNLDVLSVGQRLTIYAPVQFQTSAPAEKPATYPNTYVVKKNDTLYSIARQHGMTIKDLMELNGKDDFIIAEGEVLKIVPGE